MDIDFNDLEKAADYFMSIRDFERAAEIFYFMADGDPSLDAGYLGYKIGICHERRGNLNAARYWYGRAVEENPEIIRYSNAKTRLADVNVWELLTRVP